MNDKFILPLYFTPNRRWSKINICDLKWLILFLLVLSTLAIYVLFLNLPSDFRTVDEIGKILVPGMHDHDHDHDHDEKNQHPEPPIIIEEKPSKIKIEEKTTKAKVVEVKTKLEEENLMRQAKIKEVILKN